MAIKCEECGRLNPRKYSHGPFVGQAQELDYCKHCSADLCDDCMNKMCPDNNNDKHEPEEEEDE